MAVDRWATFDCYGTLIDWMGGIRDTLSDLWPEHDAELLLSAYHEIEPEVQRGRAVPYRQVLAESLERVAHREGLELADDDRQALGDSLPTWPPFDEVPASLAELRSRGWRIGILSNTDPEFLAASLEAIGVPVDSRSRPPRPVRTSRRTGTGSGSSSGRAPSAIGTCTSRRRCSTTSRRPTSSGCGPSGSIACARARTCRARPSSRT